MTTKIIRARAENAVEDIAFLDAELRIDPDGQTALICTLRLGPMDFEDWGVTVGVRRIRLGIETQGYDVDQTSKFGELVKPNETSTTVTTHQQDHSKAGLEIGAQADADSVTTVPIARIKATAGYAKGRTSTTKRESVAKEKHYRVRARGANKWEISENDAKQIVEGAVLRGTSLCQMAVSPGANHSEIQIFVNTTQRDLKLEPMSGTTWFEGKIIDRLTRNQQKVRDILIGKSLHRRLSSYSPDAYKGIITLSFAEASDGESDI